jgi:hypothetical protein
MIISETKVTYACDQCDITQESTTAPTNWIIFPNGIKILRVTGDMETEVVVEKKVPLHFHNRACAALYVAKKLN